MKARVEVGDCPYFLKVLVLDLHAKMGRQFSQYKSIDGVHNVWVVKPSYNSRGLGIYLSNKIKTVLQQGNKSQAKVV